MKRAERLRQLNEKYPNGISRRKAAKELNISPNLVPVAKLTKVWLPEHKYPRLGIESLVNWYYAHEELGVIR
jgi:hypothetical protein